MEDKSASVQDLYKRQVTKKPERLPYNVTFAEKTLLQVSGATQAQVTLSAARDLQEALKGTFPNAEVQVDLQYLVRTEFSLEVVQVAGGDIKQFGLPGLGQGTGEVLSKRMAKFLGVAPDSVGVAVKGDISQGQLLSRLAFADLAAQDVANGRVSDEYEATEIGGRANFTGPLDG